MTEEFTPAPADHGDATIAPMPPAAPPEVAQSQWSAPPASQPTTYVAQAEPARTYMVQAEGNSMATAGGVIGIIAFVLGLIPLIGIFFGFVLGILAIIFSGVGLSRASGAAQGRGKGMAITGLVLGIVIVVLKLIPGVNLL